MEQYKPNLSTPTFCKHQILVLGEVTLTFGTIIKTFNVFLVVSKQFFKEGTHKKKDHYVV
jgi:hypothetical protein